MSGAFLLIVDDDQDFSEGLAEFLELDGHRIHLAATGGQAIEAAGAYAYDAVFMDIELPDLNGVDCLIEIRDLIPGAACFLMTGHTRDQVKRRGFEAGALEILSKPVDPEALSGRIAALPGKRH